SVVGTYSLIVLVSFRQVRHHSTGDVLRLGVVRVGPQLFSTQAGICRPKPDGLVASMRLDHSRQFVHVQGGGEAVAVGLYPVGFTGGLSCGPVTVSLAPSQTGRV